MRSAYRVAFVLVLTSAGKGAETGRRGWPRLMAAPPGREGVALKRGIWGLVAAL